MTHSDNKDDVQNFWGLRNDQFEVVYLLYRPYTIACPQYFFYPLAKGYTCSNATVRPSVTSL